MAKSFNGSYSKGMTTKRYRDLNSYLRGLFGCRVQRIALDAGLTCPNRDGTKGIGGCIYCNARGSGTGLANRLSIIQQIQQAKERLIRRYNAKKFIAYFQSFSNTYAPVDKLKRLYREALTDPDVVGLAIGTRPDCISSEVLDLLEELNRETHLWVEYGLQSIHNATLRRINRGHTVEEFYRAVEETRKRDIETVVHVILGLPGEGKEEMLATAKALGETDIQGVKLHLLYVIKGTSLAHLYQQGKYQCLTQEEYVDIVCEFLTFLPPHVVIHRLTGDPHPQELLAPAWALKKQSNLTAIHQRLEEKDLWQGKRWNLHIDTTQSLCSNFPNI